MNDKDQIAIIHEHLWSLRDEAYGEFQSGLVPEIDDADFIGVRTPELRKYAKELLKSGGYETFINDVPHKYFDEKQLHVFIVSEIKDFNKCMELTEAYLPYVDNWGTCDQFSPKVFKKNKDKLLTHIDEWLESDLTYTVRFAIGMLMQHYLDDLFDPAYMDRIAGIRSDEYYVNMMIAWYFATALAKQPEAAMKVIEDGRLDRWTHNKAIQKAIESRRITPEQKEYLRTLKRYKTTK